MFPFTKSLPSPGAQMLSSNTSEVPMPFRASGHVGFPGDRLHQDLAGTCLEVERIVVPGMAVPAGVPALAGTAAARRPARTPRVATDRLMVVLNMVFPFRGWVACRRV